MANWGPEDPCTVTTKDIVNGIMDGNPASDNLEAVRVAEDFFYSSCPSVHQLGLIDAASLAMADGTAVVSYESTFGMHFLSCGRFCPCHDNCSTTILCPMLNGDW